MSEQVLVIPSKSMSSITFQSGFARIDFDILKELMKGSIFISRPVAENSPEYKQLIPYSILRMGNRVFRYQRTRSGGESRLFNLFSIGVGGHINPVDVGEDTNQPYSIIEKARSREVLEEFSCHLVEPPCLVGLINDDLNEVGKVHLGVVFEYQLRAEEIFPNELGNFAQFGLVDQKELFGEQSQYETWSQIVIQEYILGIPDDDEG